MIATKEQLKVAAACSTDEVRPVLQHVHLSEENGQSIAVATDAYLLAEIRTPAMPDSEYPELPILDREPSHIGYIAAKDAKRLTAGMSKRPTLPILESVQVRKNVVVSTDLETVTEVKNHSDLRFPAYQHIIPTTEPKATTKIQPKLLIKLLRALGDCTVLEIEVRSELDAIVFKATENGHEKLGLLMPTK